MVYSPSWFSVGDNRIKKSEHRTSLFYTAITFVAQSCLPYPLMKARVYSLLKFRDNRTVPSFSYNLLLLDCVFRLFVMRQYISVKKNQDFSSD